MQGRGCMGLPAGAAARPHGRCAGDAGARLFCLVGSVCPRGLIRDDPDICETPVLAAVIRAVQAFCIPIGVMAGLVVRCK